MSLDPPFRHRKRPVAQKSDLEAKVARRGGKTGYSLLDDSTHNSGSIGGFNSSNNNNEASELDSVSAGIYGSRIVSSSSSRFNRTRSFPTSAGSQSQTAPGSRRSVASQQSRFSRASATSSSARNQNVPAVHIACAISENRARETSVASMDAGSPLNLLVTKQGNGLAYAETIAYLETLQPHEILLNEGRRHSPLVRKIMQAFNVSEHQVSEMIGSTPPRRRRVNYEEQDDNDDSHYNNDHQDNRYGWLETDTTVKFLSRACFDQTRGAELLRRITREETFDATVVQDYTLLSAAHAVLQYTQSCLGATFAQNSLALAIQAGGPHRLRMDRHTVQQLELLVNSKTKTVAHTVVKSIDCTKTTVGSRLLRTNLMAPPVGIETIQTRLELVEVFLSDQDFFYAVMDHLSALPDVDKILSSLTLVPVVGNGKSVSPRMASRGISALICIKAALSSLPMFANALQGKLQALQQRFGGDGGVDDEATTRTDRSSLLVGLGGGSHASHGRVERFHLLRAILFAMTQPALSDVLRVVCEIFEERATYSRNANAMRHTECFALKCEESDLMAVLRKAYLSNVDDIYKKADEYAEIHGLHVQVRHTTTRGYFLAVPAMAHDTLPDIFLQPCMSGRYITCTTEEISSLNLRVADNVQDLLLMTHDRIQQVLDVARSHYDALAALCDAVALLDMCHSFADVVTLSPAQTWCRPVVVKGTPRQYRTHAASNGSTVGDPRGALMIRKGRFAIDVSGTGLLSPESPNEYVPNDTYATTDACFTIITGINGSGKSTYLKQIAMIVILAQCGSYVPAEQAIIPVREQFFCRIGNTDDQEHNLSTFLLEMKETAFILNHATEKSLVLVDELGRATSNEDGVAIAWATAEYLLKKRAMTFFVTHYPQLTRLSDTYPRAVQNVHLAATVQPGSYGDIRYTFQLQNGPCSVSSEYGIELAAACGWPQELVDDAFAIQQAVQEAMPDDRVCDTRPSEQDVFVADRAVTLIEETLHALREIASQTGTLSSIEIRQQLCDLQENVLTTIRESGFEDQLWKTMSSLFRDGQRLGIPYAELTGATDNVAMGGENALLDPNVDADGMSGLLHDRQGVGVHGGEMSGAMDNLSSGGESAVHKPNVDADGTSSLSSSDSSDDSESSDSDSSSSSSDGSP